jgi:hypothetical protein
MEHPTWERRLRGPLPQGLIPPRQRLPPECVDE